MSNSLSQEEINALMNAAGGADAAPEPAVEMPDDPNAIMTPEQIAALLAGADAAPEPAVEMPDDPNAIMTPEQIAALLAGADASPEPAVEMPDDPNAMMTPEQIAALLAGADASPEPAVEMPDDPNAMMTPEQIAALLAGASEAEANPEPAQDYSGLLSSMEVDAMGEIGNISMGTGATTLFALLNRRVDITTPRVRITSMRDIAKEYPLPFVCVEVSYTKGLEGTNVLFLREHDVKIITDLLMGGDGSNTDAELSDLHLSAICEVMNQMVGSSSTSLAKLLGTAIDISPPTAYRVNLGEELSHPFNNMQDVVVRTGFDLVVEGLINSEIMQVTPIKFAKRMVESLMGSAMAEANSVVPPEPAPTPPPTPAPQQQVQQVPQQQAAAPAPQPQQQPYAAAPPQAAPQQPYAAPQQPYPQPYPAPDAAAYGAPPGYPPPGYPQYPGYPPPPYGYPGYPGYGYPPPQQPQAQQPQKAQQMVDVHSMQYESFDEPLGITPGENMDLLMDVPLQVSVELGKTKKFIKEILDFNVGTIVVLDKMAGEMVDIVVNGKLIARGEVVVIDENYGARITDIVSPSKRINR